MRSKPACEATKDAPLTPPAGPESTVCTAFLHADSRLISPPSERTTWSGARTSAAASPSRTFVRYFSSTGRDVRVHQRRHGALVLAELGEDLGRDRHRQVGRDGGGDLGDHPLVAPVRVGVQQADGQRLDAVRDQLLDRLAHRRLVDRLDDRAVGADPLGHLAHVARVGERLGLLVDHEAEQRPRRPRLGEVEDVPEPARDDQADERAAPLEHGVRGDGRAVEDRVELGAGRRPPASRRGGCPRSRRPTGRAGVLGVFASQTRWPRAVVEARRP